MNIKELVDTAHKNAVKKGFWDSEKNVGEMLMLIVSELGEALEAHRIQRFADERRLDKADFKKEIKDSFQDEIADVFIRLGDLCGGMNIDIEKFIAAKMEYNKTRERLHGKRY